MAASFGAPNPATRRCRSHDQCTRARPAGVPALAAGRGALDGGLAIAGKWRPYCSLATSYLFAAAFEPTEVPSAARLGSP